MYVHLSERKTNPQVSVVYVYIVVGNPQQGKHDHFLFAPCSRLATSTLAIKLS